MNDEHKRICGAMNRQGKPCQVAPMKGRARCRLHGGKTPKGNHTGPMRHGLYSAALTEAEKAVWLDTPTGNVDDEIRMCKIWLARALALDSAINQDPHSSSNKSGLVLSEIRQSSSGDSKSTDVITRRPDTIARINMLLGRIAQLEKTRSDLIDSQAEHGDADGQPLPWVD
ncbi:HGGxSTG domain-containing protein [Skermanella aerolata]|uniref:HGGxSTG domain-containing protein n=1 Tax=Skermanella aerolata TaxID=393310 RepID=UPI00069B797D|nr:HGGxSTG domain-containing protein [Skermanella aerolata]